MKNNISRNKFSLISGLAILLVGLVLQNCDRKPKPAQQEQVATPARALVKAPPFVSDSAYEYIARQVAFGFRIPNTVAHVKCGDYLVGKLKQFGAQVTQQDFQAKAFDGTLLKSRNIIGTINPSATKRILLAAHWDSRPFAEKDSASKNSPIDGANDGASGVGVILELARIFNQSAIKPTIGIDIIFFDSEDYGHSEGMPGNSTTDSWCLGSQYWAKNLHKPNYSAYYGVLLDMVGAKGAAFAMEGTSMNYAPDVMTKIWNTANTLGYGKFFIYNKVSGITDDHSYVNSIAKIPMIDIIEYNDEAQSFFGWYHHTHKDNMDVIDKATLQAVGQTLLEVLYNE